MKFWNREKEKEWLKRYLKTEPNAILFVYGPKSSGKTTLLMKVAEDLSEHSQMAFYWYDLREELVSGYDTVLSVFFKSKGWASRMLKGLASSFKINLLAFELDMSELSDILHGKENPFSYMRRELERVRERGLRPVIVFDELQKVKEVYMNGESRQRPLVRELFNFFVRLTKVLHLSHVIVMTSDTFFIENVYVDSALKNTSEFYLVDFFDDETAVRIMTQEGMDEKTARDVIDRVGGAPWIMERILSNGNPSEKIQELFLQSKSRLLGYIDEKKMRGEDVEITYETMRKVLEREFPESEEGLKEIRRLVEAEILFYDPLRREIRFQTKLDERAVRELLGVE